MELIARLVVFVVLAVLGWNVGGLLGALVGIGLDAAFFHTADATHAGLGYTTGAIGALLGAAAGPMWLGWRWSTRD